MFDVVEKAQRVEELVAKPGNLSLMSRSHMVGRGSGLLRAVLLTPQICSSTHTYTK